MCRSAILLAIKLTFKGPGPRSYLWKGLDLWIGRSSGLRVPVWRRLSTLCHLEATDLPRRLIQILPRNEQYKCLITAAANWTKQYATEEGGLHASMFASCSCHYQCFTSITIITVMLNADAYA